MQPWPVCCARALNNLHSTDLLAAPAIQRPYCVVAGGMGQEGTAGLLTWRYRSQSVKLDALHRKVVEGWVNPEPNFKGNRHLSLLSSFAAIAHR